MQIAKSSSSITRPADTLTYTTGDVVSTAAGLRFVFANIPDFVGQGGLINSAVVTSSAFVAAAPNLELWLFDADVVAVADNAAFAPTDAETNTLVGIIEFPTGNFKSGNATAGAGGNAACFRDNLGVTFRGNTLYGVMVVRNAYVPVSAEIFTVRLFIHQ
jgi:hypothetical protein